MVLLPKAKPYLLPYREENNYDGQGAPVIEIKIINTGERPLHVSALYLSMDFGIDNRFLPDTLLQVGEEIWLTEQNNDILDRKIVLDFPNALHNSDLAEIRETFKIILSEAPINSAFFNRESTVLDIGISPRSQSPNSEASFTWNEKWRVENLLLSIVRPLEPQAIHDKNPIFEYGPIFIWL